VLHVGIDGAPEPAGAGVHKIGNSAILVCGLETLAQHLLSSLNSTDYFRLLAIDLSHNQSSATASEQKAENVVRVNTRRAKQKTVRRRRDRGTWSNRFNADKSSMIAKTGNKERIRDLPYLPVDTVSIPATVSTRRTGNSARAVDGSHGSHRIHILFHNHYHPLCMCMEFVSQEAPTNHSNLQFEYMRPLMCLPSVKLPQSLRYSVF